MGKDDGASVGVCDGLAEGAALNGVVTIQSIVLEDDSIVTAGIIPVQSAFVGQGMLSKQVT